MRAPHRSSWPLLLLLAFIPPLAATARPPNVILILSDDQGSVDVDCYRADDLLPPPAVRLDGRRLATLLRDPGTPSPHETLPLIWVFGTGPRVEWALRLGDWKLLVNARDGRHPDGPDARIPLFLANLRDDVGERENLADRHSEIVARLRTLHERHLDAP